MSKIDELELKKNGNHEYYDSGKGELVILLHGLFGTLSNWEEVIHYLNKKFRVIIPILPLHTIERRKATVQGLTEYFESFVSDFGFEQMHLVGNSLGGHIGLKYTLAHPEKVKSLTLAASSGLFERGMGETYPKRTYEYVKERVEFTFYDPKIATKAMVDQVHATVNNLGKCLRMISIAKSAQRDNMTDVLPKIQVPTCLIWGLNDTITPPMVAHEFNRLIKTSELYFLDKCCHVPMMELPLKFNQTLEAFIQRQ